MKDKLIISKSPPTETIALRLRKRLWNLVKEYLWKSNNERFYRKEKKIYYSEYIQKLIVKDLREKKKKGELKEIDNELLKVLEEIKLEEDKNY